MQSKLANSSVACTRVRAGEVTAPSGVVAWQSPNGHVMVSWNDAPDHNNQHKYVFCVHAALSIIVQYDFYTNRSAHTAFED